MHVDVREKIADYKAIRMVATGMDARVNRSKIGPEPSCSGGQGTESASPNDSNEDYESAQESFSGRTASKNATDNTAISLDASSEQK